MKATPSPSFSRSGRSGAGGKQTERVGTDVSESLLCDLNDAVEDLPRAHPDGEPCRGGAIDSRGRPAGLYHVSPRSFPAAKNMGFEALEKTMATLAGKSLEEFRRMVMTKHIFGRLQAVEDIVGDAPDLGQPLNAAGIGTVSDMNGSTHR